jgi:hypothetical protein
MCYTYPFQTFYDKGHLRGIMLRKIVSIFLVFLLGFGPEIVYAREFSMAQLPLPGTALKASLPMAPVLLQGLVLYPQQPLHFRFIVGQGETAADAATLQEESTRMMKYFLAAVTIPAQDQWVNLSPFEKERMVPEELGQTDLGRDLLAQDYVLKQFTASLLSPDTDLGRAFWARVQSGSMDTVGAADMAADVFNKVWVMPETAEVYEQGQAVYVTKARLKVMLDSDYSAGQALAQSTAITDNASSREAVKNVMRAMILPVIEKEMNEGAQFAVARQIYYAGILASWYRGKIKDSLMASAYMDQARVQGIDLDDKSLKEQIYQRYIAAYKKGVVNFIREEEDLATGMVMPRRYFSGGMNQVSLPPAAMITRTTETPDAAMAVTVDFAAQSERAADRWQAGPYASVMLSQEENDLLSASSLVNVAGVEILPGAYFLTLKEMAVRLAAQRVLPQGALRRQALVVGRAENDLTTLVLKSLTPNLNLAVVTVDPSRKMQADDDMSITIPTQVAVQYPFLNIRVNTEENLSALKKVLLAHLYDKAKENLGDDAEQLLKKTVAAERWRQGRVALTTGDEVALWEAKRVFQEIVRIESLAADEQQQKDLRVLAQFLNGNDLTPRAIAASPYNKTLGVALENLKGGKILNANGQVSPVAKAVLRATYNFAPPAELVILDPVLDGKGLDFNQSILVEPVITKELPVARPVSPYSAVDLTPQENRFFDGGKNALIHFKGEYLQPRVVYKILKEMMIRLASPLIINQGARNVLGVSAPGRLNRIFVTELLYDDRFEVVDVNPNEKFGTNFPDQIGVRFKWTAWLVSLIKAPQELLPLHDDYQERIISWAKNNLPEGSVALLLQSRRESLQQDGRISLRRSSDKQETRSVGAGVERVDAVYAWQEIRGINDGNNESRKRALSTVVRFLKEQKTGGLAIDTHKTNVALQSALTELRKNPNPGSSWFPRIVMLNNEVLPQVADLLRSSFDTKDGNLVLMNPVEGENTDPNKSSLLKAERKPTDQAEMTEAKSNQLKDFALFPVPFTAAEMSFVGNGKNTKISVGEKSYDLETVYSAAKDIAVRLAAARIKVLSPFNPELIVANPRNVATAALLQTLLQNMNIKSFEIQANEDYPAQIVVRFSGGLFFQHSKGQLLRVRTELLKRLNIFAEEMMGKEGKALLAEAMIDALWREGKVLLRSGDEIAVAEAAPLFKQVVTIETGEKDSPQRLALHVLVGFLAENKMEPKVIKAYWNKDKLLEALDTFKESLFVDQDKKVSSVAAAVLRSAFVVYQNGEVFLRDPIDNGKGVDYKQSRLLTDAAKQAVSSDAGPLGGFDLRNVDVQRSGEGAALQLDEAALRALEAGDFKGLTPVFLGSATVASPLAAMASQ